jgi:hypothetical protein
MWKHRPDRADLETIGRFRRMCQLATLALKIS